MSDPQLEKLEELRYLAKELEIYAQLEQSEIGELTVKLINLVSSFPYMTTEFQDALSNEMLEMLMNFQANSRIVSKEETVTNKYKELEWIL